VYKARDSSLDRLVALKVLHPQLTVDSSFLERFRKEARDLARINHPNVVTIFEIGEVEGKVYIAMEYLPGGSLRDKLAEGPLMLHESLKVLQELGAGLGAGHNKDIIHRDVKPENILFNDRQEAVIADFGLAKALQISSSSMHSNVSSAGTPYYRPPELWMEQPPSPATDIYSLTCVLFEMLTGEILFFGETSPGVMKKHFDPVNLKSDSGIEIPRGIKTVLKKALARDQMDRYQVITDFLDTLQNSAQKSLKTQQKPRILREKKTRLDVQSDVPHDISAPSDKSKNDIPFSVHLPFGKHITLPGWVIRVFAGIAALVILSVIIWIITTRLNSVQEEQQALPEQPSSTETKSPDPTQTTTLMPELTPTNTPAPTLTLTLVPTPTLGIGSTKVNEVDNADMVYVPAGEFLMGSEDPDAENDEDPEHTVYLDAFWIYTYEVTNKQYRLCIESGGCEGNLNDYPQNNYPAVNIDWYEADTYCAWAGVRLPTEAEWEKAARGTDGRTYPWGEETPSCNLANYVDCASDGPVPVGSFPDGASYYGALDMAGNVYEWVMDSYDIDYYLTSSKENPVRLGDTGLKILRGGSYGTKVNYLRGSYRRPTGPLNGYQRNGFRCVYPETP